jgi:YD repeat-containing protein
MTQVVDPDSATTTFGYDSYHQIATEVSPNNKTATVTYDSFHRVQSESLFGGTGTTTISYAQSQGLIAAGGSAAVTKGANPQGDCTISHIPNSTFSR